MLWNRRQLLGLVGSAGLTPLLPAAAVARGDPLPSWTNGAGKARILRFVQSVTRGSDFVPPAQRIATFDNDGTLWSEQPLYFQLLFALDRIKALASEHPEWRDQMPYKAIIDNDAVAMTRLSERDIVQIVVATHAGMSVDQFQAIVLDWLKTARHARFNRPYTDLVYQPMLELLRFLRANGFKTFIVSGGGVDFMRPWVEHVYGIPPEEVVGSSGKTAYRLAGDRPAIEKLAEVDFVDDGPGKPVGINRFIGRRPIFAAGNSDGDREMLEWTTLAAGPRLGLIVHHTDAAREWAYDRQSSIGNLDKAWDEAAKRDWLIVDMKTDWRVVYPFHRPSVP
jgi:phosphoglycolate phosphatase-like HAD superfamily hydrolase